MTSVHTKSQSGIETLQYLCLKSPETISLERQSLYFLDLYKRLIENTKILTVVFSPLIFLIKYIMLSFLFNRQYILVVTTLLKC